MLTLVTDLTSITNLTTITNLAIVADLTSITNLATITIVMTLSHLRRAASMVATIVTAVPTVTHARVLLACSVRTEMIVTTLVIAAATIMAPAVSTTIGQVEVWTTKVEVVTMRIAGIDAKVPNTSLPIEWAVEVGSGAEQIPLPAIEDIADIQVATLPVGTKHIVITCDAHQIIQIDLIGSLILCIRQVQLVGHLVGQEERLSASLLV